ncbi:hypothetical protein P1X14_04690 [Sphingomonas sp. AOB5]|uniref:hypothetical protein n=1 Tax=Sphingomonas sp. AOB5 TaxID=3034017 RepID=UPI0023F86AF3|nr:hypothetical protein [Sphingomonas sp. AOB5]MDF7774534.1 hypothetical protein [Sphingomonas sp. AOB5]
MRLAFVAIAAVTLASTSPAAAQAVTAMYPTMATDRENRDILVLVSEPRAGNPRPYRAIIAWQGQPGNYWSLTFAFDCGARKSSQMGSAMRNWNREELNSSFPLGEMYRGYLDWVMAPVICDGKGRDWPIESYTEGVAFVKEFADQFR